MGAVQGSHSRRLADRLAGSELGLSLTPGLGIKARLGDRGAPDPVQALHELLATLTETAAKHSGGVLFLDEFQDLAHIDGLDAILRSHLQHAREVAVLMAGSRPSMMRTLFTDMSRAFYSQAELVDLGPLTTQAARQVVLDGFEATRLDATSVVDRIVRTTQGHPQRLMLLADRVWSATADRYNAGSDVSEADYRAGLNAARNTTAPEFEATWRRLSESSRAVLRSVVRFGSPSARAGERFLDLTAGSSASAARALVDDAVLHRSDGDGSPTWRLVDPFFADWIDLTLP